MKKSIIMMKYLLVILSFITLLSCNTAKWCANNCPQSIIKDTIEITRTDSLHIRDTIFKIEADTLFMTDSIDCPDYSKEFGSTKTKVKVVIKNKHIYVQVINKAQEFKAQLFDHYRTIYEKHSHFEQRAGVVKHKTWLSFWESWVCMGLLLVILIRWILKTFKLKIALQPMFPFITITK